jgi:hypothetical protein
MSHPLKIEGVWVYKIFLNARRFKMSLERGCAFLSKWGSAQNITGSSDTAHAYSVVDGIQKGHAGRLRSQHPQVERMGMAVADR